jgi:filamentous hemagglutinin family protein
MASSSALALTLALPAARAQTLPTGGVVAQGTASIGAPSGGHLTITQTSARAVVNWTGFNVGAGGVVTFAQPNSSSAILNRVAANAGQSVIDGQISGNGQVFLVNPNGVAISSTGVVNTTGGFVASSLDVSDSDFMAGTLNFSGSATGPGVSNAGSITAGSGGFVALIGQSAGNSGTITVPLGKVGLGAAASATLDLTGTGFLQVVLPADATNAAGQALVSNSGTITAGGGAVTLSAAVAANAVQQAVNMSGTISATAVSGVSGAVTLSASPGGDMAVGGTIDVSDSAGGTGGVISIVGGGAVTETGVLKATSTNTGGRVDITGASVALTGASVDVSGTNAGGLIRIGGAFDGGAADNGYSDYQYFVTRFGTLPSLANAGTVTVDAASSLQANGTLPTDPYNTGTTGGTIILFSTQNTSISTSNWRAGGVNGAAEVSSWGVISNLTFSAVQPPDSFYGYVVTGADTADHLFYSAKDILIADNPDSSGSSYINRLGLMRSIENALTATITASDAITVTGDFDPSEASGSPRLPASLSAVTLDAGRAISVNGVLASDDANLTLTVNDPTANDYQPGDRVTGPAVLDLRNATLNGGLSGGNGQLDITLSLLSGDDNAVDGLIRLPAIDGAYLSQNFYGARSGFNTLSIAAQGQGVIEFNGNVSSNLGYTGDGIGGGGAYLPIGTLELAGTLAFATDATIASANLIWNGQSVTSSYVASQQAAGQIIAAANGRSGFVANFTFGFPDPNQTVSAGTEYPITSIATGTVSGPTVGLPFGGEVVSGAATIDGSVPNVLTVTESTEQAVVNWQSFNIGAGGTVSFVQPDASAAILNRVAASSASFASAINGTLSANGRVYMVNPNGIAIGATGVVNTTGGFIAWSGDLSLANFAAGILTFTGASAGVTNAGSITVGTGGLVALLGSTVTNSGTVTAPGGQIALAAGAGVSLGPADGSLVTVTAASPDATAADALLSQTGTLTTVGGTISLKAESSALNLGQTIINTGTLTAQGVSTSGGSIFVSAINAGAILGGTFAADQSSLGAGNYLSGGTGGVISVAADGLTTLTGAFTVQGDTGGRIDATAATLDFTGATLDASGQTAGGLLRIGAAYRYGAADDGGSDYQAFVARFGALPSLAVAGTVTIDNATTLRAGGGTTGGALIVGSTTLTTLGAPWADAIADVSISSLGAVAALPGLGTVQGLNTLQLGAKTIEVTSGAPSASGVTAFDLAGLTGSINGLTNLIVEAGDTLSVTAGATLGLTAGDHLTLEAGRGITFTGAFNAGGASLIAVANQAGADGAPSTARGAGAGFIDLTAGTVTSQAVNPGSLDFILAPGLDNAVGGQIRLGAIDRSGGVAGQSLFGDLTLEADDAGRIVLNGAIATQAGALTLTGDLQVDGASILTSNALTWTNAASAAIYGPGTGNSAFSADFALVNNGTVIQSGVVGDGQAARIALDGLSPSASATAVYGAAASDLANEAFRLINGALASGDTLGTDLSPGLVTVGTGSASLLGVGSHHLTVTLAGGLPQPGAKVGYVFDLTASSVGAVSITPRPVTFTTQDATTTYGTLASLSGTLSNVLVGDTVTPVFGLSASGSAVALSARTTAGAYQIVAASLSGASAPNYSVSATGDTAGTLTISPLQLSGYAGPSLTGVYGTAPTLAGGVLSGVLGGDQVTAVLGLTQNGAAVNLSSRVNAGTYGVTLTGLGGAQGADYSLPTANLTAGQLVVSPLSISASLSAANYVYGSPSAIVTLNGVLSGDVLTPTVSLTPSGGTAAAVTLEANGGGFGLGAHTSAGAYSAQVAGLVGAQASDYVLNANLSAAAIQITPKPLTFSVPAGQTSVYGDDSVSGATLTGVLSGDTVTPVYYAQSGGAASAALIPQTPVGAYALSVGALGGSSAGDYVIAATGNANGSLTITQKPISYTLENLVSTYGSVASPVLLTPGLLTGDNVTFSVHVFGNNSLTPSNIYTPATNGNPYNLAFTIGGTAAGNYYFQDSGANSDPTWTVNRKVITYAGGDAQSVYGGPVALSAALAGVLPNDQVSGAIAVTTPGGAGVTYDAHTDVGAYDIGIASLSGAQAANYLIDPSVFGALTITAKALSYGGGVINAVYGTASALPANLVGVVAGDDVSAAPIVTAAGGGAVAYGATTTVGTYSLSETSLTGAKAFDYTLTSGGTGSLIIGPKTVTYAGGNVSATYGTAASLSSAINGLVAGDSVTAPLVITASGGGAVTYGARTGAGSYVLSLGALSGAEAVDYVIDPSVTGALVVAPKTLSLTSGAFVATYGDATLPNSAAAATVTGGQFSGILSGDTVAGTFTIATPTFSTSARLAAGTYGLSISTGGADLTGAQAADYVLSVNSPTTGSLVVAPKALSLVSGTLSATYGDAALQSGGAVSNQTGGIFSGVLSGDTIQGVFGVSASLDSNGRLDAGTYATALLPGSAGLTGAAAADYTLSGASPTIGTLVVAPKSITLVSAALTAAYGAAPQGTPGGVPTTTGGTFSGLLTGDAVTGVFGVGGTLNSAGRLDAGAYGLTLSVGAAGLTGAQAGDYVVAAASPTAGTLSVTPLTVAYGGGSVSTTYGILATLSATPTGLLTGDQVTAPISVTTSGGGQVIYGARTTAGTYTLGLGTLSGAEALDYVVNPSVTGALTIARASITLTSGALGATYGDGSVVNNTVTGGQFAGVLTGDQVEGSFGIVSPLTTPSGNLAAGSYGLTLASGFAGLTGAQSADYVLAPASPTTGLLTVAPKTLTYTLGSATSVYGAPAPPTPTFAGLLAGDTVLGQYDVAAGSAAPAPLGVHTGVGAYSLSLGGITGAQAADYVLTAAGSTLGSLTITPAPLDFTSSFLNQTYGSVSTANFLSGVVAGDAISVSLNVSDASGAAVTLASRTNAGGYLAELSGLSGAAATNYVLAPDAMRGEVLTIAPLAITYELTSVASSPAAQAKLYQQGLADDSFTYGSEGTVLSFQGALPGDSVSPVTSSGSLVAGSGGAYALAQTTNAGSYTLALTGLSGAQSANYTLVNGGPLSSITVNVLKSVLTFSTDASTAIYGNGAAIFKVTGLASFDQTSFGISFTNAQNAAFTQSLSVGPGGLITLPATFSVGTYSAFDVSVPAALDQNYIIKGSNGATGNVLAFMKAYSLTITPRPVTFAIGAYSWVYGSPLSPSDTLTNVLSGDAVSGVVSTLTGGVTNSTANPNVGSYSLTTTSLTGAAASNYTIATTGDTLGSLTVTPRPITYSLAPLSSVYGASPSFTYTISGGFSGMGAPITGVSASLGSQTTLVPSTADIGTYYAQLVGITGDSLSNYTVTFANAATALLTITPRPVTFNASYSTAYGSNVVPVAQFQAQTSTAGLVSGDTLTATTAITGQTISTLDVGTYAYDQLTFGGPKLNDYAITVTGSQTVTVAPKLLQVQIQGNSAIYGSIYNPGATITVSGFLATNGLSLTTDTIDHQANGNVDDGNAYAGFQYANSSTSLQLEPLGGEDACNCTISVTGLSGPKAKDYALPSNSGSFIIYPAPLTLVTPGAATVTYGSTVIAGPQFEGFYSPSDAGAIRFNLASSNAAVVSALSSTGASVVGVGSIYGQGDLFNSSFNAGGSAALLDVGSYSYTVTGLSGAKSRDYYLVGGSTTNTVTITPATLSYSVLQDEYYGRQQGIYYNGNLGTPSTDIGEPGTFCCVMAPDTRPLYSITSNTFGAALSLNLSFVDASGVSHTYTPTLEGGTYAVNAAITGAKASDFVVASTPISFTIHPAIVTYVIDDVTYNTVYGSDVTDNYPGGYYVQGVGFISGGAAPTAKLIGTVASDNVALVIGLFSGTDIQNRDGANLVNIDTAPPGLYHYQAVGLLGDANNYVLGGTAQGIDIGAEMEIVSTTLTFNPTASLSVSVAQGVTVGSLSAGTGTATSSSSLPTDLTTVLTASAGASAGVTAGASGSTALGSATLTGQVGSTAGVTATAGLGNTSASVTVGTSATLTVSYGPGYTAVGADAYANSTGSITLISKSPNISGEASAEAEAYVTTGVAGSLGAAGTGSASAVGGVGAETSTEGSVGIKNGTVTAGGGVWAGAGVSGDVQGQVSGSVGSAGAGVTGYLGSAGVTVDPSVGYSNGQVTLSGTVGLGVGPVGIEINLNVGVNVGAAVDGLHTAVDAIGDALGFGSGPSAPDFASSIRAITANPFTNPTAYRDQLYGIINNYQNYANIDPNMLSTMTSVLNAQSDYQAKVTQVIPALQATTAALFNKLKTNPASFTVSDVQSLQNAQRDEATALAQLKSDVSAMTGGKDQAVVTPTGISIVSTAAPAAAATAQTAASAGATGASTPATTTTPSTTGAMTAVAGILG